MRSDRPLRELARIVFVFELHERRALTRELHHFTKQSFERADRFAVFLGRAVSLGRVTVENRLWRLKCSAENPNFVEKSAEVRGNRDFSWKILGFHRVKQFFSVKYQNSRLKNQFLSRYLPFGEISQKI